MGRVKTAAGDRWVGEGDSPAMYNVVENMWVYVGGARAITVDASTKMVLSPYVCIGVRVIEVYLTHHIGTMCVRIIRLFSK